MTDRDTDLLSDFINQHIYNGAPGAGQALYNYGGNPYLQERIEQFLTDRAAESYFATAERLFGDDERLMQAVRRARSDRAAARIRQDVDRARLARRRRCTVACTYINPFT